MLENERVQVFIQSTDKYDRIWVPLRSYGMYWNNNFGCSMEIVKRSL